MVTGVDSNGRSAVVEVSELIFSAATADIGLDSVFETHESPPPARPQGHGTLLDLGVGPGLARWHVVEYRPEAEYPIHHTDTIDFDIVLSGSIELILDDGAHRLTEGDCVVVTGVDHAWRAGPEGCQLNVIALGTPPH